MQIDSFVVREMAEEMTGSLRVSLNSEKLSL